MTVEQRLTDALKHIDRVEPSDDLWSRVVHSIDEDRRHRRQVVVSTCVTIATIVVLTAIGALFLIDGPRGRYVRPGVFELLVTVSLVVLVGVLGPAIRRFGRGYASDLWPTSPSTAIGLLRLLDVAYLLVFAGFILASADLTFAEADPGQSACLVADPACQTLAGQLQVAATRIGGLLLTMGVLHGATIVVLPVLALVSNSTKAGRALPKWITVALVVGLVLVVLLLLQGIVGIILGATGS